MTSLFPSLFEAVVFWGILVLWVLAFLIWAVRHSKKGKRRQDFLPLNALAIVVGIAIAYARIGVLPNWLFYPGETLFVVGNSFALWSMSLLGRSTTSGACPTSQARRASTKGIHFVAWVSQSSHPEPALYVQAKPVPSNASISARQSALLTIATEHIYCANILSMDGGGGVA